MRILSNNYPIELMADDGYCLTNDEIYTTYVVLGKFDKIDNWKEILIEEVPEDAELS